MKSSREAPQQVNVPLVLSITSRYAHKICRMLDQVLLQDVQPSRKFGEALRAQVDERLRFYAEGVNPTKNELAMVRRCI